MKVNILWVTESDIFGKELTNNSNKPTQEEKKCPRKLWRGVKDSGVDWQSMALKLHTVF